MNFLLFDQKYWIDSSFALTLFSLTYKHQLICSDADRVPRDSGGTLIVLPVSLLVQWEEEIQSKAPHLKFFTYNGDNVISIHNECGTVSGVMKQLMTYGKNVTKNHLPDIKPRQKLC